MFFADVTEENSGQYECSGYNIHDDPLIATSHLYIATSEG